MVKLKLKRYRVDLFGDSAGLALVKRLYLTCTERGCAEKIAAASLTECGAVVYEIEEVKIGG